MKIASLEDDPAQSKLIEHILTRAGHTCVSYSSSKAFLDVLQTSQPYDLLLVDWEVPDLTGIEVVRWIRRHIGYDLPIIFVTQRTAEEDLVAGLQAGADDYVAKPVKSAELLARIDVLVRRHALAANVESCLEVGPYTVDTAAGSISLHGVPVTLARKEYELAVLFFRNPWRLFSRDVLSTTVWNREIPATSRTLDTHLSNIRQKLKLRPENGVQLTASYALGYRLELVPDTAADT